MFRSFLMGIIKQRDFPGWVSGENGSLRGPRRRKAPRVSITRQLRFDGKSRTYGFETPFRVPPFSSQSTFYSMTLFITSSILDKKYDCSKSFQRIFTSVFNFLFAINKMSSINRHGGFLSKILQFNEYTIYSARNSPIYFPIHGQNCGDGIAQSLASMPQPTREFYIASRFSPIVYYTRINNIKAARNRPVSNAESLPFVVRGLRNPSSPRISHLHLSVSNARF